jgi:hypothetical protein
MAVIATALTLSVSTASWAAGAPSQAAEQAPASQSPLAPGKAAGISRAQDFSDHPLFVAGGLAILGTGIALLVSNNGHHSTTTSTSTSTTTH